MSLSGDLTALSIVDVIQLMHTIRKSGTLSVKGKRGESRIVFADGYIVGANHNSKSVRIGSVLVDMESISQDQLDAALDIQKNAGDLRKSLIVMLVQEGMLKKEAAVKGLERLIQLTVVDLISWRNGTFIFMEEATDVSDEYRFMNEELHHEICLDTQMVLMDALRIFDEMKRDGLISEEEEEEETEQAEEETAEESSEEISEGAGLSADDLGLSDLDEIEVEIPKTFKGLETFDPAKIHREKSKELLADFSAEEQDAFLSFLDRYSASMSADESAAKHTGDSHALIFFSRDELTQHSLMTVCKHEGIHVVTASEAKEIDAKIGQCLSSNIIPLLVYDSPEGHDGGLSKEDIVKLRQEKKGKFPQVPSLQLNSSPDYAFSLTAFDQGVKAVFPRPSREVQKGNFIENTIKFLETFLIYLADFYKDQDRHIQTETQIHHLKDHALALRELETPQEITLALLKFASEIFARTMSLVCKSDLIADMGIGLGPGKEKGASPAPELKIPIGSPSLFLDVIEKGELFLGQSNDPLLKKHLFNAIGTPENSTILLLPFKSRGKVIALIYGDFGDHAPSPVLEDALTIFADQASLVLDSARERKKTGSAA